MMETGRHCMFYCALHIKMIMKGLVSYFIVSLLNKKGKRTCAALNVLRLRH